MPSTLYLGICSRGREICSRSLSCSPPPSCLFTDETFPIDSEAIITTYPVSWLQCVVQAFLLYVKKVSFSAPFSPPSPPTQDPQYNNRTAVVKSIKVRVLYSSTFQKELV